MGHRLVLIAGGRSEEAPLTLRSAQFIMETARASGVSARVIELGSEKDERRRMLDHIAEDEIVYPLVSGLEGVLHFYDHPYVGAHPTLAGLAADKVLFNDFAVRLGFGKVPYVWGTARDVAPRVEAAGLTGALYVKPARLGASKGITRVEAPGDLDPAVRVAASHDPKVLVEQSVPAPFFEVEIAGIAGKELILSSPCRVGVAEGFAWREHAAKILKTTLTPIEAPDLRNEIELTARTLIAELGYIGPFRMDLFVHGTGRVYVGEMNALPGQSSISTFPQMFAASGVPRKQQLEHLIGAALELRRSLAGDRSRY